MIQMRVDTSQLKAEIAKMIAEQDALSQKAANHILIEGKNAAHALVLKDTNALDDSIETTSKVTRIAPCIYDITLANGMDYGAAQETGPVESKKVWRFRPHIRPGAFIMQAKASEVFDRVYGD